MKTKMKINLALASIATLAILTGCATRSTSDRDADHSTRKSQVVEVPQVTPVVAPTKTAYEEAQKILSPQNSWEISAGWEKENLSKFVATYPQDRNVPQIQARLDRIKKLEERAAELVKTKQLDKCADYEDLVKILGEPTLTVSRGSSDIYTTFKLIGDPDVKGQGHTGEGLYGYIQAGVVVLRPAKTIMMTGQLSWVVDLAATQAAQQNPENRAKLGKITLIQTGARYFDQ